MPTPFLAHNNPKQHTLLCSSISDLLRNRSLHPWHCHASLDLFSAPLFACVLDSSFFLQCWARQVTSASGKRSKPASATHETKAVHETAHPHKAVDTSCTPSSQRSHRRTRDYGWSAHRLLRILHARVVRGTSSHDMSVYNVLRCAVRRTAQQALTEISDLLTRSLRDLLTGAPSAAPEPSAHKE